MKQIKDIKIVLLERNHIDELKYYKDFVDFVKKIIKFLIVLLYKKADKIIGNSYDLSRSLQKLVKNKYLYYLQSMLLFLNKNKKNFIIINISIF